MIFNASNIDLKHFDVILAHYDPKWIHAEAIQVTEENIGRLSLEFEEELYEGDGRGLWFGFDAARSLEDGSPDTPNELFVRVGSWIVALRGELHVYSDNVFRNTFRIEPRDEYTPPNAQDQRLTTVETRDTYAPPKTVGEQIQEYVDRNQIKFDLGDAEKTQNAYGVKGNPLPSVGVETSEKTEIVPAVGELDTDESNGSV